MKLLYIGLGGFLGAICRYSISKSINIFLPTAYIPWGTISVNIVGAFILAYLLAGNNTLRFNIPPDLLVFLGTGFLGAFTTFSTFTYETIVVFEESPLKGMIYAGVTLLAGFVAACIGFVLGKANV